MELCLPVINFHFGKASMIICRKLTKPKCCWLTFSNQVEHGLDAPLDLFQFILVRDFFAIVSPCQAQQACCHKKSYCYGDPHPLKVVELVLDAYYSMPLYTRVNTESGTHGQMCIVQHAHISTYLVCFIQSANRLQSNKKHPRCYCVSLVQLRPQFFYPLSNLCTFIDFQGLLHKWDSPAKSY